MAGVSIDTYAATNPAFCSIVLYSFAEGFASKNASGMPFSFILLPIPVVLTREIAQSFEGTNAKTGLLSWVAQHPEVTVGFRERLLHTAEYSKQGLLFGAQYGVFTIAENGRIFIRPAALKKRPPTTGRTSITAPLKFAKRFGAWIGEAGSTETILIALGVNR